MFVNIPSNIPPSFKIVFRAIHVEFQKLLLKGDTETKEASAFVGRQPVEISIYQLIEDRETG